MQVVAGWQAKTVARMTVSTCQLQTPMDSSPQKQPKVVFCFQHLCCLDPHARLSHIESDPEMCQKTIHFLPMALSSPFSISYEHLFSLQLVIPSGPKYLCCCPVRGLRVPSQAQAGHEPCSTKDLSYPVDASGQTIPFHPGSNCPEHISVCNLVASGGKTTPGEHVPKVHGTILRQTEHYTGQRLLSCGLSAGTLFEGRLMIMQAGEECYRTHGTALPALGKAAPSNIIPL